MIIDLINICVSKLTLHDFARLQIDEFINWETYCKHTNQKLPTLNNACKGGYYSLVFYMIGNKNSKKIHTKKNRAVYNACQSGNVKLVDFLVNNGFVYTQNIFINACKDNHNNLVFYLHEKLGMEGTNKCIDIASKNGNLELLKYLIEKMKLNASKKSVEYSSKNGHLNILKYLFTTSSINSKYTNNRCINNATRNGHLEVVRYLHQQGLKTSSKAVDIAIKSGNINIAKYLCDKMSNKKMKKNAITHLKKLENKSCDLAIKEFCNNNN